MSWEIREGDALALLREMPSASIDAVVTDPPYELGFMGKAWDGTGIAYSVDLWREALRVLKPGGHLLAFGGTRTYHRMACAIEDAGFEIRDSLHWMYGTGFPKSLNVGEGRGTALKPAHEPIVMARKPLVGTVAANVAEFGTGALNIDSGRIPSDGSHKRPFQPTNNGRAVFGDQRGFMPTNAEGRWPANVLFAHLPDCTDEECAPGCAVAELDRQSGIASPQKARIATAQASYSIGTFKTGVRSAAVPADDGCGASRFFYVAKPSRKERDLGCDGLPLKTGGDACNRKDGSAGMNSPRVGANSGGGRNFHPTVKPIDLMRYLVRLVTPLGGLVLDPFTGSGTTGMAAVLEGMCFIGFEREAAYIEIARRRLDDATRQGVLFGANQ